MQKGQSWFGDWEMTPRKLKRECGEEENPNKVMVNNEVTHANHKREPQKTIDDKEAGIENWWRKIADHESLQRKNSEEETMI